ncbi:hypothetical protein BDR07DRAFT_1402372, partial [Suillus spraguei]
LQDQTLTQAPRLMTSLMQVHPLHWHNLVSLCVNSFVIPIHTATGRLAISFLVAHLKCVVR